jgi:hypothetical protein
VDENDKEEPDNDHDDIINEPVPAVIPTKPVPHPLNKLDSQPAANGADPRLTHLVNVPRMPPVKPGDDSANESDDNASGELYVYFQPLPT